MMKMAMDFSNGKKSYTELSRIQDYEKRFEYLKLSGTVGEKTFGSERYLNQIFYGSPEWKAFRREILIRDSGCDMGMADHDIFDRIEIHHINPITIDDVKNRSNALMDPENVICVSSATHKAIHYGDRSLLPKPYIGRSPNDTCPWKL